MPIQQIAPANDWFFVQYPAEPDNAVVVYPVAVWALDPEGLVIGLISVAGGGRGDSTMGQTCKLIAPPPLRGKYKRLEELTEAEKKSYLEDKPVKPE